MTRPDKIERLRRRLQRTAQESREQNDALRKELDAQIAMRMGCQGIIEMFHHALTAIAERRFLVDNAADEAKLMADLAQQALELPDGTEPEAPHAARD